MTKARQQNSWLAMKPFMFPSQKWQDAIDDAKGVLRLLELRKPSRILDLPCGLGRHSVILAQEGHKVTGVDLSPDFLEEARCRSKAAEVEVEWRQGDMKNFCLANSFDAALNLYTSFGYFKDPADDLQVLKNFFSSLKPNGKLLMDLMSRDIFVKKFEGTVRKEQTDGSLLLSEHTFDEQGSWLENKWSLISKGNHIEANMGLRLYTRAELCALLSQVGFISLYIYGDFDGRSYDDMATRLVIVAKKPEIIST